LSETNPCLTREFYTFNTVEAVPLGQLGGRVRGDVRLERAV
jgi:hypothetical protein